MASAISKTGNMGEEQQTVYLVDDNLDILTSLSMLLDNAGFRVRSFASPQAFLDALSAEATGCLVLDLQMPEMNGLQVQEAVHARCPELPVVFLTGHGNVPSTVRAIKHGAVDFLEKPAPKEVLIDRIENAFLIERQRRARRAWESQVRRCYAELTSRERDVMQLVTEGLSNKTIARQLQISPRTVEAHRARLMDKMRAANLPELCAMATCCLGRGQGPRLG